METKENLACPKGGGGRGFRKSFYIKKRKVRKMKCTAVGICGGPSDNGGEIDSEGKKEPVQWKKKKPGRWAKAHKGGKRSGNGQNEKKGGFVSKQGKGEVLTAGDRAD